MKRDWDVIRDILLKVEELEPDKKLTTQDFDEQIINKINYHIDLLDKEGLIKAIIARDETESIVKFALLNLTWDGHEFLDSIRDDDIWNKTKSKVIEKGGILTFDIVKTVALSVLKSTMGL